MHTCFIIEFSEKFRENSNKTRDYANSIWRVRSIVTIHLSASVVLMRSVIGPVLFICSTHIYHVIFFGLNLMMACAKIITF